jgi:hypothetical protein
MEGVLYLPPDRPQRAPEIACLDCGQPFRPHRVADGVEELCELCYQARFQPLRRRNGHRLALWLGSARLQAAQEP